MSPDRRRASACGGEAGSGGVLAVAVLAMLAALALAVVGLGVALAERQRIVAAADAAALAAADTALGIIPGVPCDAARAVAEAHGATLARCEVDGVVATVVAAAPIAGIRVEVAARAGPPRAGQLTGTSMWPLSRSNSPASAAASI